MAKNQSRAWLSWLYLAVLFILCAVLAALQYRWIGAVSSAERDRLQTSLQASLNRVEADFNSELAAACRALLAPEPAFGLPAFEATIESRWPQWKQAGRNAQVFRAIAVATPRNGALALRSLDPEGGVFRDAQWPPEWEDLKTRLESFAGNFRGMPGPPLASQDLIFEIPLFRRGPMGRGGEGFPGFAPDEASWMIVQLSRAYLRDVLLPEVLQRHLGAGRSLEYYVEVLTRADPPEVLYRSDSEAPRKIAVRADASVALLDQQFEQLLRRPGPPGFREPGGRGGPGFGRGGGPGMLALGRGGPGMGRGGAPNFGRWELRVQHRAGSLEAAVSRTRRRNLAVTGGVLLLMVAAFAALVNFTRRSQKLADMQMSFVAGVSHELRTPLTVLHTAGYNLRGKLARDPSQVERYGALIQRESARLRDLVEQVLLFASGKSGSLVRAPEPMPVEAAIEAALESLQPDLAGAACKIETKIEPGLPTSWATLFR
jgi:signal transduction histidine kinase